MLLYLVLVPLIGSVLTAENGAGQSTCMERAEQVSVNTTDCCKIPELIDMKIYNETYEKILKEGKATPGTPLFDCLIEQTFFISQKFVDDKGNINAAKITAKIEEAVKDPAWKKILTTSVSKCLVDSKKFADVIQKASEVPKELCDFKYDTLSDCIEIAIFMECPESSWIKSMPNSNASITKECDFAKAFIKDCYMEIDAFDNFLDHQKD